jgi:starvation-inducible DNA-binding protein
MNDKTVLLLNHNLAIAIDLALQSKQAHWNVKGPHFLQLHELFDRLYAKAQSWGDALAERAVQLGGIAEGTLAAVSSRTNLPAYRTELLAGRAHVEAITASLSTFAKSVREAIDISADHRDPGTSDLFTEISREADEMLWMVEAHLLPER